MRRSLSLPALLLVPLLSSFYASRTLRADFVRGDVDGNGSVEMTDAVRIFGHLFLGNPKTLACQDAADPSDRGSIDLSAGIYLLNFLFVGGSPPAEPYPHCGDDPTNDKLGCESYASCPDVPDASDLDADGIPNQKDNCPLTPNPKQEDQDHDRVGDVCDNCPTVRNPGQELGACWSASLDDHFAQIAKSVPEFAGFYYAGDALQVALTDPSPRVLKRAEAAIRDGFGSRVDLSRVEAVPVEYDFATLQAVREAVRGLAGLEGLTFLDTNEVENRVVIGVESRALLPAIRKAVERARVDMDTLLFEERKRFVPQVDLQGSTVRFRAVCKSRAGSALSASSRHETERSASSRIPTARWEPVPRTRTSTSPRCRTTSASRPLTPPSTIRA